VAGEVVTISGSFFHECGGHEQRPLCILHQDS
jgi:hypothetical protein